MSALGIVVIGRNEGERLRRCLRSLAGAGRTLVYVDSGSTDGSVAVARDAGWSVVELDPRLPFSAARARNEGLRRLLEAEPATEWVQFVDGDCEVAAGWIGSALAALRAAPETAVICGRRRERHPEASLYNRFCDLEWDTPVGDALACGGDFLARVRALEQVGGFDATVVAGEEPEICLRLRRAGWKIRRIASEMTLHDAAILRFGQWWRRMVRSGHAYAQATAMHPGFCLRENASIVWWSAIWPLAALGLAGPTRGLSLWMLAAYPLQIARIARKESRRAPPADAWRYAAFCVLGKWAQHAGQWKYALARWRGRLPGLIEYKGGAGG
jgi:GT2 family glycosyltransferase